MKMFDQVDILKYVQRRASKSMAKRIKREANKDATFKADLDLMKFIYTESSKLKDFKEFDLDQEWVQITKVFQPVSKERTVESNTGAKLITLPSSVRARKRKSRNWLSAVAIAASLLLLMSIGLFLDQIQSDPVAEAQTQPVVLPQIDDVKVVTEPEVIVQDDKMVHLAASSDYKIVEAELPDGSLVKLNPNAKISYEKDFETAPERVVYLEGVAFFDVETDKKRKFIIKDYASLVVEVLGTAFTVELYPDGQAEIRNKEGRVKGFKADKPEISVILSKGEIATYNGSAFKKIEPLVPAQDFIQPIDYIINNIIKGYGHKVSIAPGAIIGKDSINYQHSVLPLESILMILGTKINFDFKRDGQNIVIKNATIN